VQPHKRYPQKLFKRFNLAMLKAYRKEEITQIRNTNHDLYVLVNAAVVRSAWQSPAKAQVPVVAAYYKQVRAHAVALYGALKEKLENPSCKCPTAHEAGLQLEVRRNETTKADTKLNTDLRFKCVFPFDWQQKEVPWREIELQRVDSDNEDAIADPKQSDETVHVSRVQSVEHKTDSSYRSVVSRTESLHVVHGRNTHPPTTHRYVAADTRLQSRLLTIYTAR
jgi:hypothetical protein